MTDHPPTETDGTLIDANIIAGVAATDGQVAGPYPLVTLELTIARTDGTVETVRTFGVDPELAARLGATLLDGAHKAAAAHDAIRRLN